MERKLLEVLRSPGRLLPLAEQDGMLVEVGGDRRFPIRQGIPVLLPPRLDRRTVGLRAFYDRVAFAYDATLRAADRLQLASEERVRREILADLQAPPGSLVVDVGCGTGSNRGCFAAGVTYLGIDISFGMLRRAQRKFRGYSQTWWVQGDAHALPVGSGQAELVVAMGVLQHLNQPKLALAELGRVAKKKHARVVIIDEVGSLPALARRFDGQTRLHTVAELARLWQGATQMELTRELVLGNYFIAELR